MVPITFKNAHSSGGPTIVGSRCGLPDSYFLYMDGGSDKNLNYEFKINFALMFTK